jgi:hypothetical protein
METGNEVKMQLNPHAFRKMKQAEANFLRLWRPQRKRITKRRRRVTKWARQFKTWLDKLIGFK